MVEDEVTVKRFQLDGTTIVLQPENKQFAPIRIENGERVRILGKVIGVFRKLQDKRPTILVSHLLEDGYDIRMGQELLGHKDVSTAMIYTHVLNRGGRGIHSPADRLGFDLERPLESAGID